MIKEAIEKILDLSASPSIEVDGKRFMTAKYEPVLELYPQTMGINNLTGIVDFTKECQEEWSNTFIHVADYNSVVLYQGKTGQFNQRTPIVKSSSRPFTFRFGQFITVEQLIISLNSGFIQNEGRDYILNFVAGVRVDGNSKMQDDGISQTLKAKSGVSSLVKDIPIKNIVALKPFRTFSEIEQPESDFIFRMRLDSENQPSCGIFEADGEAWKQDAIIKIKSFFKENIPDVPVIA